MLLHRYTSIDYIMRMPYEIGIRQINKAIEEENDSRLWEVWLTVYPNMSEKNFLSFEEFKKKQTRKKQTDQDMVLMARALNAAFGGVEVLN